MTSIKSPKYATPLIPIHESDRLSALKKLNVLDTPPEQNLDEITLIASQICDTPIALITLIDENRQWFKSNIGLDATETPRDISFCAHAINESAIFIVEDTQADDRFKENPLVLADPKIRFYAGSQLVTSDGQNIGTLCVIDRNPKKLTPEQIKALEALARQITLNLEHRKLQAETSDRERFLKNILGALPELISYIDLDYRYQYANSAYQNWLSVDPNEILGKKITEIVGETVFLPAKPYMDKALQGERQDFQLTLPYLIHGQTVSKVVQIHYIPDLQRDGKIHGFFAVLTDITPLKKAEETALEQGKKLEAALKQALVSEESFRSIFENSPIGILQLDPNLRFLSVNSAFTEFLGYSDAELKKLSVFDVTFPDDIKTTTEAVNQVQGKTIRLNRFEKRYLHKSGKIVWGAVTSRLADINSNGEKFIISAVEDITESREKDAELKAAHSQLISSSKMSALGEMAGGIAHEINNPLAIINSRAELIEKRILKGDHDTNKIVTDLTSIKATAERIAKIVRGLRSFSRNSENDPMQTISFSMIVYETLALCKERFKSYNIDLRVDCTDEFWIECRGTQISQIIMSLLNNAFDAVENLTEKWISITLSGDQESLRFEVTDSGNGIPPSITERMMEPFFTTKEVGKGTGLGLSISKGIAESHHGKLRYDSSTPHTCFLLELPLRQPKTDSLKK